MLVSLLQPTPETYDCFDDVMVGVSRSRRDFVLGLPHGPGLPSLSATNVQHAALLAGKPGQCTMVL